MTRLATASDIMFMRLFADELDCSGSQSQSQSQSGSGLFPGTGRGTVWWQKRGSCLTVGGAEADSQRAVQTCSSRKDEPVRSQLKLRLNNFSSLPLFFFF